VTTTTRTTDVAVVDPAFSDAERYALAAPLAGYRGLTREAYALDLRQFIAWCQEHHLRLFGVRRATGRQRFMFGALALTTSPTPPVWTATTSVRCSSRRDWRRRASTRLSRCWLSTGCESPKRSVPTSRRSASNVAIAP